MCDATPERQRMIEATAWFAQLASAAEKRDFVAAGEAQAALSRLGVLVKFRRSPTLKEITCGKT